MQFYKMAIYEFQKLLFYKKININYQKRVALEDNKLQTNNY